jgi:hypothetical protein
MKTMRPTPWCCLLMVVALGVANAVRAATTGTPHPERDYISADELAARAAAAKSSNATLSVGVRFPGAVCTACWGDVVFYTSIAANAVEVQARRYDASEITLIVPDNLTQRPELTDERIRVLVGKLDALYSAYRRLNNGRAPARSHDPAGKHIFAYTETLSGPAGLGLLDGDIAEAALPNTPVQPLDDDLIPAIWVHELAHNFDMTRIGNYGADPAHDWTVLLEGWFAPEVLANDISRDMNGASFARQFYQLFFEPYLTDPALTWVACAASFMLPECTAKRIFNPHGHVLTFAARAIGPDMTRQWIAQRYADQLAGVNFANQEEVRDYYFTSLAEATRTNTSCLSGMLNWPMLDSTRARLASRYTATFPACLDQDGDLSLAGFDCNDNDAATHPRGTEAADQRDNDCDGVVDNVVFDEASTPGGDFSGAEPGVAALRFPLRLVGRIDSEFDVDLVRIAAPLDQRVQVRVCTTGATLLRVNARTTRGTSLVAAIDGVCTQSAVEADRTLRALEIRSNTLSPAPYTIDVFREPAASAAPRLALVRGAQGEVRVVPPPANATVSGTAADDGLELVLRSNLRGERVRRPYDASNPGLFADLQAGEFTAPGAPLELRATVERQGFALPITSNAYLISTPADLGTVDIGIDASGSWFNPAHDGEGFMIEILEGGRALVYWFTYDDRNITASLGSAQQMFLVGDGALDGKILRVPLLYRVLDGAFGTALDPSRLRAVAVGSLEFSFADQNRATVHYRIDGRDGETSLTRLTRIDRSTSARGLSGNWYDPRYSGQGLIVQELGAGRLFSVFFTHDDSGQPRWFTVDGQIATNGQVTWSAPLVARGGVFGRGFRPASVTRDVEGLFESNLSCAGASLRMRVPKISARTETLQLVRLTTPAGTRCTN